MARKKQAARRAAGDRMRRKQLKQARLAQESSAQEGKVETTATQRERKLVENPASVMKAKSETSPSPDRDQTVRQSKRRRSERIKDREFVLWSEVGPENLEEKPTTKWVAINDTTQFPAPNYGLTRDSSTTISGATGHENGIDKLEGHIKVEQIDSPLPERISDSPDSTSTIPPYLGSQPSTFIATQAKYNTSTATVELAIGGLFGQLSPIVLAYETEKSQKIRDLELQIRNLRQKLNTVRMNELINRKAQKELENLRIVFGAAKDVNTFGGSFATSAFGEFGVKMEALHKVLTDMENTK